MDTLGKRFHVNFLACEHWFMSIVISQVNYHSISVDHAGYATSVVDKYLDTSTVKKSTKFYKTTLPSNIIFTNDHISINDEQVDNVSREFNIHHRDCIGSLIFLLSTRVYLSFVVHKLGYVS